MVAPSARQSSRDRGLLLMALGGQSRSTVVAAGAGGTEQVLGGAKRLSARQVFLFACLQQRPLFEHEQLSRHILTCRLVKRGGGTPWKEDVETLFKPKPGTPRTKCGATTAGVPTLILNPGMKHIIPSVDDLRAMWRPCGAGIGMDQQGLLRVLDRDVFCERRRRKVCIASNREKYETWSERLSNLQNNQRTTFLCCLFLLQPMRADQPAGDHDLARRRQVHWSERWLF